MVSPTSSPWTTGPEYIELLDFLIEKSESVESPMSIRLLTREFKGKSGAAQTEKSLEQRIERVRRIIHSFEHIDTNTKVKLMFALSASINSDLLKELKKDAFVEVDDKKRIIHYKANDGRLELRGDHSRSAKISIGRLESKRSYRSMITSYFENNDNADAVPKNKKEEEVWKLIDFITEKCDNVESPLNITRLVEDFVEKFRSSIAAVTARSRIRKYGLEIQKTEFVDTRSKVQQLFGLSATVNSDCLQKLQKNALIEVDEKNRIVFYKANNGSLELRGDHSMSAKTTNSYLESKRSHPKLIRDYFENKNNSDAVPENEEEKEMWNLIQLITEKCENIDFPLNISQLTRDFNKHFGCSRSSYCIQRRSKNYCHEIQKAEFLDTSSKVKQLFGLGATLDSDCLEKLRKDAVLEVDDLNRITKYTANDGRLALHGDHSTSAKNKLGWIERRKNKKSVKKHSNYDGDKSDESEKENGYTDDDSDEYSSEEFGSEFGSDDENDPLDETTDLTEPSNEAVDFDIDTSARNRSPTEIPIVDNFDSDTPTGRSHLSEETRMKEVIGEENDHISTKNASVKTRYGRLSKRRHMDSEISYNLAYSSSSEVPMSTDSLSPKSAKQKKMEIEKEQASISSSQSRSSSRSKRRSNLAVFTDSEDSEEEGEAQQVSRAARNNARTPNVIRIPTRLIPKKITPIFLTKTPGGSFRTRNRKNSEEGELVDPLDSTPATSLRESASRLHLSKVPEKLPCREDEAGEVQKFIRKVIDPKRGEKSKENMANQDAPRAEDNKPDCHRSGNQEVEDYDYNPREVNTPESSSIDNRLGEPDPSAADYHNPSIEDQNTDNRADAVASEPEPVEETLTPQISKNSTPPTNGKGIISQEVPIKVENGEPMIVENPTEDVKPETTHNFKIKFFNAMNSLILSLDTPSLSNLQSKIKQKIRKIGRSGEMISNDEMILSLELLAARMTNHSVVDISEGVESVSLIQFFCFLKASILNSKMIGVDGLVENISKRIEDSRNK
ncbi:unnamed protein product, partial [Caenorhabditis brenneri]